MNNVIIHKFKLSNLAGVIPLYYIENSPISFSLGRAISVESEMTLTVRLAAVVNFHESRIFSFIRIDVEDYEVIVFYGAMVTIKSTKPVIRFEVAHSAISRAGLKSSAPYKFLSEIGYLFYQYSDAAEFKSCVVPQEGNIFAVDKKHLLRYPFVLKQDLISIDMLSPNALLI